MDLDRMTDAIDPLRRNRGIFGARPLQQAITCFAFSFARLPTLWRDGTREASASRRPGFRPQPRTYQAELPRARVRGGGRSVVSPASLARSTAARIGDSIR